jgi:hypothetical protein
MLAAPRLITTETCFILGIDPRADVAPQRLPLTCGGELSPGDIFTTLGKEGSAFYRSRDMRDGWVQQYAGLTRYEHSTMALFNAYSLSQGDALGGYKSKRDGLDYYLAYVWMGDDNKDKPDLVFTYMLPCQSLRCIRTNFIKRVE